MTMPRLPVPLPPTSMVPVDKKPLDDRILPAVVSIRTATPLSVLVLERAPLLVTVLAELRVMAGVPEVAMLIPPVASMTILPLEEVLRAVLVLVVTVVSARADATPRAAVSRA